MPKSYKFEVDASNGGVCSGETFTPKDEVEMRNEEKAKDNSAKEVMPMVGVLEVVGLYVQHLAIHLILHCVSPM